MSRALLIQQLGDPLDRVLAVVGESAGEAHGGWVARAQIRATLEQLKVPVPGRLDALLARLRRAGLLTRRETQPSWALSPLGEQHVAALLGPSPGAARSLSERGPLAPILPPEGLRGGIADLVREHPYGDNVFVMTRFPSPGELLAQVIDAVRDVLAHHGLISHLASDRTRDRELAANVATLSWGCPYGVALFEDRAGRGLNHNMLVELGGMLKIGATCLLLRDSATVTRMPTNLVGHIFVEVDYADIDAVRSELHRWAAVDLGRPRRRWR